MKITILEGPHAGRSFETTSPSVSIGRDGGNQLILDTDGVSRCHAELRQQPDGSWMIFDLNSTNGVKIGGRRINDFAPVADGTQVGIGENLLEFSQLSSEPARVIFTPIISAPEEDAGAISTPPAGMGAAPAPAPAPAPAVPPSVPGNIFNPAAAGAVETPVSAAAPEEGAPGPQADKAAFQMGEELKKFSGSLFGQKKKSAAEGASSEARGADDPKKRRSNLIFYTILVCVVIMILSAAFSIMNPSKKKGATVRRVQPLAVRYEKEVISKGNVFRFDFYLKSEMGKKQRKLADGRTESYYAREYSVAFTVDDVASRRHFSRTVPISDETVNELRTVIRSSGIYANTPSDKKGGDTINRRLTIVDGNRLLNCSVTGEYASTEFNAVEEEIVSVAKNFGLETISMTPEQLISQAKKHFLNGQDLYDNRRADPKNLRQAIKSFKIVTESLEQFSPKPPMWEQARIKLAAAEKERNELLDALETEYKKLAQLRRFAELKDIFKRTMDLTDPESREHSVAKKRLIRIEQLLWGKKKR